MLCPFLSYGGCGLAAKAESGRQVWNRRYGLILSHLRDVSKDPADSFIHQIKEMTAVLLIIRKPDGSRNLEVRRP